MDLRTKITDAVYDHPRAPDIIDAVMGVIEARLNELEAEAERQASGDPWDYGYIQAINDMRGVVMGLDAEEGTPACPACGHKVDGLLIGEQVCVLVPGHDSDHQGADGTLWENFTV